jgi:hypothetical protein
VKELIVKLRITHKNGPNFIAKAMLNSGCTHTCINEETVSRETIPQVKLPKTIKCTNSDRSISRNKPITDFVQIKMNIDGHKENIDSVVTQLDSADIFIGYDWLTKHNLTINWENSIIKFTRCPPEYKTQHHDITLPANLRKLKTENNKLDHKKEMDKTNPEDLLDYIQPFTHLFNKKNFNQLPK